MYVEGNGYIRVRSDAPIENIEASLYDIFTELPSTEYGSDYIELTVNVYEDKYHDDEAMDMLQELAPYVIDGSIDLYCTGGGCEPAMWRYRFADGTWVHGEARIIWAESRMDENGAVSCSPYVYLLQDPEGKDIRAFADKDDAEAACRKLCLGTGAGYKIKELPLE